MATKKRKSTKKGHRRKHRVGALGLNPSSPIVQGAVVVAGFLTADKYINPAVDKMTGTMDAKVVSAAEVGIGALLLLNKKTKKHWLAVVPGGLLAGAGLKRGLKAMGVITGYQDVSVVGRHQMNSYGKVKVVGTMPQQSLNGMGGGLTIPRPVGNQIVGNANGSGITHGSSNFMD